MLRAMVGMCSQRWMPEALVSCALKGPLGDCPGLGSQVSMWLGPPASQSRMTESHLAISPAAMAELRRRSTRFMPRKLKAPAFISERRLKPDFPSQSTIPWLVPVGTGFMGGSFCRTELLLRSRSVSYLSGAGAPFYFTYVNSLALNKAQYTSSIHSRCNFGSGAVGARETTDVISLDVGMRVSTAMNISCAICWALCFASITCLIIGEPLMAPLSRSPFIISSACTIEPESSRLHTVELRSG